MKIEIHNYSSRPSIVIINDDEVIQLLRRAFMVGREACFFRHYGYRTAKKTTCPECGQDLIREDTL